MRILIVTQYFYPESFRVNTLTRELVNRGHSVTVLTGYPQYPYGEIYEGYGFNIPYNNTWCGARVIRLKVAPRGHNFIGLIKNCLSFVREGYKWVKKCKDKFDLIYVFEVSPVTVGLPAIKYKKKFGTPILFNVQDLWPENVIEVLGVNNKLIISVINKIVDYIYKNSDKILCSSNGFVKNIEQRGIPADKLIYWPQFCETPDFENIKQPACYDNNYFNVVFTGNIGYAQGLDLLIETAERLKNTPVRWYIVGDGRAKDELIKMVSDRGIESQIIFVGKVSESEANCYVKFSDCAYLSFSDCSLFDLTIPAKLQTYLACGAPVLGAVGGESAEIIRKANCGLIAQKRADDVSAKLIELMNLSSDAINNLRSNSLAYFNANFKLDKIVDDLECIFNDL